MKNKSNLLKGLFATLSIWTDCLGGFTTAIDYCTNLAKEAGELLTTSWSTSYLVTPSLCTTFLCIQLPTAFVTKILNENLIENVPELMGNLTYDQAELVQNYLYKLKIELPVKCVQQTLYVRVSCHVYNCIEDYKRLARVVLAEI